MSQVTIEVSDRVVSRAAEVAGRSQRPIEEVLAEWLEQWISEMPVESLSDKDVLALAELELPVEQQRELDELLVRNREGELDSEGAHDLDKLMHIYEHGLLRKAKALRIAVERGLREPLHS